MNHLQIVEAVRKATSSALEPASMTAIVEAEMLLGFRIPSLLRTLYLEVGNGGFGPGYQVLGVNGGHLSDEGDSIAELYQILSSPDLEEPEWQWPMAVVPFCHWGCAIYSAVDTTSSGQPVVWFDPNVREAGEPMHTSFIEHRPSIESWFSGWLAGEDLWAETYGVD